MNSVSDETLIEQVQQGDIAAFETLVRRWQRVLLSFVYRIVHNDGLSAEVVQDAFLSLYKTIDRVDTKRKFSSYLFQIAKNIAISTLRKMKKTVSLDEIDSPVDEDVSLFERIVTGETQDRVRTAVLALPPNYRRVIQLYYFDDLSYGEIGKKLRLPVGTVRTHLSRAKVALRKKLSHEET